MYIEAVQNAVEWKKMIQVGRVVCHHFYAADKSKLSEIHRKMSEV